MGVDITATCVLWVRARLDYEPMFSFLDGLHGDNGSRYWISEHVIEMNNCDRGADMGHTVTEVKIALLMSHNILTSAEEYVK
jgi:hypothetical protein